MKPGSRHSIHRGINFVITPPPIVNPAYHIEFQRALVAHSVEYSRCMRLEQPQELRIEVVRDAPTPLQIIVIAMKGQPLGQLIVAAPQPARSLETFVQEVEFVAAAFDDIWPAPQRQIIKRDVTLRDLYETTSEHAFQELWEGNLGQTSESLKALGGPVQGGGLRFVMPPHPDRRAQVEVKIESYLADSSKIFVETQFAWPEPTAPGISFDPRERLEEVDRYASNEVQRFLMGGE